MWRIWSIAVLATLALGSTLTQVASAEGGTEQSNVQMFFGYYWPDHTKVENTTTVFTGKKWQKAVHAGHLNLGVDLATGMSAVGLTLTKGEKIVEAFADYGTIATPTFKNFPWNGKHLMPLHKRLTAKDGKKYDIALSDISVLVYDPQRPLPPQKGTK